MELDIPVFRNLSVPEKLRIVHPRFRVMILHPDGTDMAVMSAGPKCAVEFCKPTAEKHAKEYTATWGRPTKVEPV